MTPVKVVVTVGPDGTVTVDHLPFAPGEQVEVTITPQPVVPWPDPNDPTEGGKYPLRGKQPYRYDDPFASAWVDNEWES
jgi:hypothetical protein